MNLELNTDAIAKVVLDDRAFNAALDAAQDAFTAGEEEQGQCKAAIQAYLWALTQPNEKQLLHAVRYNNPNPPKAMPTTMPHVKLPVLYATDFVDTSHATAGDKLAFAQWLTRFIAKGMPETMFAKTKYRRLSMMFGHIAHYSRDGFWFEWFETAEKRKAFLRNIIEWGCHGSPEHTFCDVEKIVQKWVRLNWCGLNTLADRED